MQEAAQRERLLRKALGRLGKRGVVRVSPRAANSGWNTTRLFTLYIKYERSLDNVLQRCWHRRSYDPIPPQLSSTQAMALWVESVELSRQHTVRPHAHALALAPAGPTPSPSVAPRTPSPADSSR